MRINFRTTDYGILGQMPDNSWRLFVNEEEYTNAYYDAYYELNNEFRLEYPEVA